LHSATISVANSIALRVSSAFVITHSFVGQFFKTGFDLFLDTTALCYSIASVFHISFFTGNTKKQKKTKKEIVQRANVVDVTDINYFIELLIYEITN
jgi:hypothetical protein